MHVMITSVRKFLVRLRNDERGLTAIEYAVLGALVVAAIGLGGGAMTTNLGTKLTALVPA